MTYTFEPEERVDHFRNSGHLFNILHFRNHEVNLQPRFSRHRNRQFLLIKRKPRINDNETLCN